MTQEYSILEKRVNDLTEIVEKRHDESNKKLDLLLDLAKQMAVIQEKQVYNTEAIKKVEKDIQESEESAKSLAKIAEEKIRKVEEDRMRSNERIHARIDELQSIVESRHAKVIDESKVSFTKITTDQKTLNDKIDALQTEYHGRVNFIRGVVFALAAVATLAQAVVYKYLDNIETTLSDTRVAIQKLDNKFNETERQIDLLQTQLRSKGRNDAQP